MELGELEQRLLGDLWASPALAESLRYLCDECNGRFAGTRDERRAGDFLFDRLRAGGLANVAFETFEMPGWTRGGAELVWVRGAESHELRCAELPGSPAGVVDGLWVDAGPGAAENFERLGRAASGCIVLITAGGPHRLETYARACLAGAAAFIFAHNAPGALIPTGSLSLGPDRAPAPGVGVSFETAALLRRQAEHGAVRLRLETRGEPCAVEARNVAAEIPGRDPEAGWILICAHYDGHDVAQGAQDNATGTAVILEAARVLAPLQSYLEVGLRFCLFSGEEMGLHGSRAYTRRHCGELDDVRVVVNADVVGLASPLIVAVQNRHELAERLCGPTIAGLDVLVEDGMATAHSDHFPFVLSGVAACAVHTTAPRMGDWAHTAADTLDKLDLGELREAAGAVARILLRLAVVPDRLPRGRQSADAVKQTLVDAGLEDSLRLQGSWPF